MPEMNFIILGILLIFLGFILLFAGSLAKGDTKIGIGGFIGPFAFGWANSPKMLKFVIALTAIAAILFIVFTLKL